MYSGYNLVMSFAAFVFQNKGMCSIIYWIYSCIREQVRFLPSWVLISLGSRTECENETVAMRFF